MKLSTSGRLSLILVFGCTGSVTAAILHNHGSTRSQTLSGPTSMLEVIPVPAFSDDHNINPKRVPSGSFYVGCFRDVQRAHVRYYNDHIPKEDRRPMNKEVCWDFCRNVSGVQFFGLRDGRQCYCTPYFTKDLGGAMGASDGSCDMICEGGAGAGLVMGGGSMCGGQTMSSIFEMHDEANLPPDPCKKPPTPVTNAKVFTSSYYVGAPQPCSNAVDRPLDTVSNSFCHVECKDGFHLEESDLECRERGDRLIYSWAQISGTALCVPTGCGAVKPVTNAITPRSKVSFPDFVDINCLLGYSFTANDSSDGLRRAQCRANGTFSHVGHCEPIECGSCPNKPAKYPNATAQDGTRMRVYKEVCAYDCEPGFTLDRRSDGGNNFEIACTHTGEFTEPPTCQPVTCGAAPSLPFAVTRDIFEADHKVSFPDVVHYDCLPGYTLSGQVGGQAVLQVKCQADAVFSIAPACKPVEIGHPPKVNNSVYIDRVYVYGESVTYTCDDGYTAIGNLVLHTGVDGQWVGDAPQCEPVVCGAPPSFSHATCEAGVPASVNFESSPLHYTCSPGYSTSLVDDLWQPTKASFSVSCQPSGHFTVPPVCLNVNDCAVRNCGQHGKCRDLAPPTGIPLDDSTCDCDSGYEITLHNSTLKVGEFRKLCTNINDCPADACGGQNAQKQQRGICVDGLNEYDCECGAGYNKTQTAAGGRNWTCSPISCGVVKSIGNATAAPELFGQKVNYDTPSWRVSCNLGYSQTGTPDGQQNSDISCTTLGTMSSAPSCLPVSCGGPQCGQHSSMHPASAELVYPNSVECTCDKGFALGSDVEGSHSFEIRCLDSGDLNATHAVGGQQPSCTAVSCGVLADQANASWNTTKQYVYGESAIVHCDDGYSIDGSNAEGSDRYKAPCQSNGTFSPRHQCQPVKCLNLPKVKHSTHAPTGDFVFGDAVTYTMDPGYSVNVEGVAKIGGNFTCHCNADGEFNGTCAKQTLSPHVIDCGVAPQVSHAVVTGSTKFGGTLTATALPGYTLDGFTTGETIFRFGCLVTGRFSSTLEFLPVSCSPVPTYNNVDTSLTTNGSPLRGPIFGATTEYTCEDGYHAASGSGTMSNPVSKVSQDSPNKFSISCTASGAFKVQGGMPADTECVPVTCDVGWNSIAKEVPLDGNPRLQFKGVWNYICSTGSSLDGQPNGQAEFTESCGANGQMSLTNTCQDIDWCVLSRCGANGKCQDGLLGYKCNCTAGYQVTFVEGSLEACTQIDECLTLGGYGRCSSGGGSCVDNLLNYTCSCADGYENVLTSDHLDSCSAVLCPVLPSLANAASDMEGGKLSYPETATYSCDPGYTLDGDVYGTASFTVSCQADATLGGVSKACQPVRCPAAPDVENSTCQTGAELVYGENRQYTCNDGHTTSGEAAGPASFNITCSSSGELSPSQQCLPVSCGKPPVIISANGPTMPVMFFAQTGSYACRPGYTVDGQAGSVAKFDITCQGEGHFSGIKSCSPVSCGIFEGVSNGQSTGDELFYGDAATIVCDTGYTEDADPNGEGTFVKSCGSDGDFLGNGTCKAVTCGEPVDTAKATVPRSAKFYLEMATWTCKAGFSTDGSSTGSRKFTKMCGANGIFGRSSPSDCQDINYCAGDPCGANGGCADLGEGVPFPGYNCSCFEGYEVRQRTDGSDFCSADDCAGDPCGDGGTCTDLSKLGGEQGQYSCDCEAGYNLTKTQAGKDTCGRIVCGILPAVQNAKSTASGHRYTVTAWKGDVEIDAFYDQPKLLSHDVATFICKDGYSTDQSTNPEAKDFRVECDARGELSIAVEEEKDALCMPVLCADAHLPTITHAQLANTPPFTYKMSAEYSCVDGHTLTGEVGGDSSFKVACQANGLFSRTRHTCQPVSCKIPATPRASAVQSRSSVLFGKYVSYQCLHGNFIGGVPSEVTRSFIGECKASGELGFDSADRCEPAKCSGVPMQKDVISNNASGKPLVFGESARYECSPSHTLGGLYAGTTTYEVHCQADGTLSGSVFFALEESMIAGGPPDGVECQKATLRISGLVTDAEVGSKKLENVRVRIRSEDTGEDYIAYTDSDGIYVLEVPAGRATLEGQGDGYITRTKGPFDLQSSVQPGQGMDIALSLPLGADDWRFVLSWGASPLDLDSHTFFGCDLQEEVSVRAGRDKYSERAGGLSVKLDRDKATGYGPETTTIKDGGQCNEAGCCLAQFKVHHHGDDGSLSSSGATVTVYKGGQKLAKYDVPCITGSKWWTVLTLDLSLGVNKLYEGNWARAPYLTWAHEGYADWSLSMDHAKWSRADPTSGGRAFLYGLDLPVSGPLHRLSGAPYFIVRGATKSPPDGCTEVNFGNKLKNAKWAKCPEGSYLAGFYRTGSRFDNLDGFEQITKGYCCTQGHPEDKGQTWGQCRDQKLTPESIECEPFGAAPAALVGLKTVKKPGGAVSAPAAGGPSARHADRASGVFLGGEYILLGFSKEAGKMGKLGAFGAPLDWPSRQDGLEGIGMLANDKGFSSDPENMRTIDYFLPGEPEESFWAGYTNGGDYFEGHNFGSSVEDTSAETFPLASALTTGFVSDLKVTQKVTLGRDARFFKNVITIKNTGMMTMEEVRYMRSVDPDNTVDAGGAYKTTQQISKTFRNGDKKEIVWAKSRGHDPYYQMTGRKAVVLYYSNDPRARGSFGNRGGEEGLRPEGVYDSRVYDSLPAKGAQLTKDAYMSMAFDVGILAPGQEVTVSYFTALDNRPISEIVADVEEAAKEILALDEIKCCSLHQLDLIGPGDACSSA